MQVQIVPPLLPQQPVTVQPMQHAQAKLKWLLEQVHMVRSTQPSICKKLVPTGARCVDKRVLGTGLSQQCRHNKEENEKLHKICNDYKARKVLLCLCFVLASAAL